MVVLHNRDSFWCCDEGDVNKSLEPFNGRIVYLLPSRYISACSICVMAWRHIPTRKWVPQICPPRLQRNRLLIPPSKDLQFTLINQLETTEKGGGGKKWWPNRTTSSEIFRRCSLVMKRPIWGSLIWHTVNTVSFRSPSRSFFWRLSFSLRYLWHAASSFYKR